MAGREAGCVCQGEAARLVMNRGGVRWVRRPGTPGGQGLPGCLPGLGEWGRVVEMSNPRELRLAVPSRPWEGK